MIHTATNSTPADAIKFALEQYHGMPFEAIPQEILQQWVMETVKLGAQDSVKPASVSADEHNFQAWSALALELLQEQSDWTAIDDSERLGYVVKVTVNGHPALFAVGKQAEGYEYSADDLLELELDSWRDSGTVQLWCSMLEAPKLVQLAHAQD